MKKWVRVLLDLFIINASLLLAYGIRFSGLIPITKGVPALSIYLKTLLLIDVGYLFVFKLVRLEKEQLRIDEFFSLTKTISLLTILLMAFTFVYRAESYSRIVVFLFLPLSVLLLSLSRVGKQETKRVVIVGSGEAVQELQNRLPASCHLVGTLAQISELTPLVKQKKVDEVIIASPQSDMNILNAISTYNEIAFYVVPSYFDYLIDNTTFNQLNGLPLLSIKQTALDGFNLFVKRVIDVIGSSLAILLLTPVLLTTAIAVKLTSEGPIIYHQLRCSKHGKLFRIYKLRSMRVGAEKDKPVWAVGNDPRCTPIGNFLRRTCLDELVQFFNVLKGDISLVGPRPERPYFIQQFKKKLPTYLERLNVKAGMTGWAQVHGLNGDTSVEERLKYDLFYVQNWSLLFDLKILLLTIPFLFKQVVKR